MLEKRIGAQPAQGSPEWRRDIVLLCWVLQAPLRMEILHALGQERDGMSVMDLKRTLRRSPSAVSEGLRMLRLAGLITMLPRRKVSRYRVGGPGLSLLSQLVRVFNGADERPQLRNGTSRH
jgi:DNA-binding transcriptional ArsR family regulator